MTHLNLGFIDDVLNEPAPRLGALLEPRYIVEIFSKPGRHRPTGVNKLSLHENGGVHMIKAHKDLLVVVTLPRGSQPNLSLKVEVRHTFSGVGKDGRALRPSATIHDLRANPDDGTFTFVLRPIHTAHGKGPRPADDPNAFTLFLHLYNGEGLSLDVSTLNFGAFANPNSRERARRVLSVVPCFLNTGLATLTPASKEAFLQGSEPQPTTFGLGEPQQHDPALEVGFTEYQNSPSSSLGEIDAAEEYQDFSSILESESVPIPFEFVNSPCTEYFSPLFEDQF